MADANSTSPQSPSDEWAEIYARMSHSDKASRAMEMLEEINERNSKLYAMASSITDRLKEQSGGDSPEINAYWLSCAMEDILGDIAQHNRLMSCLKSLASEVEAGHA